MLFCTDNAVCCTWRNNRKLERTDSYMKKIASLMIAAAVAASMAVPAFAETPSVYLNGEQMTFDADPFIENDRALVPVRAIFEACGATVAWDQDTLTVIGTKNVTDDSGNDNLSTVVLQIDNTTAFVDGEPVELDVPAKVVQDRTFVPLRFIADSLGAEVNWDQEAFRVDIDIALEENASAEENTTENTVTEETTAEEENTSEEETADGAENAAEEENTVTE